MSGLRTGFGTPGTLRDSLRRTWRTSFHLVAAVLVWLLPLAGIASAEWMIIPNERWMEVGSTHTDITRQELTQDLSIPFNDVLRLEETVTIDDVAAAVNTSAMQQWLLDGDTLIAAGHGNAYAASAESLVAFGRSMFDVTIRLEEPRSYVLDALLKLTPPGNDLRGAFGWIRLTGPSGLLHELYLAEDAVDPIPPGGRLDFTGSRAFKGTLPAGDYQLQAYVEGQGTANYLRCVDFELAMTIGDVVVIPEPSSLTIGLLLTPLLVWRLRGRAGRRSVRS